jgi:putative ABC transport system ATP-binding protein
VSAAVRCRGLVKSYAGPDGTEVRALRGVDLEVMPGETMMLAGPSGCGKTTLVSILAGVLRRDAGTCEVLGVDQQALPPAEAAAFRRREIGFVFQAFNLVPTLSALENAMLPLLLSGMGRRAARDPAREALAAVGLAGREEARPAQLSGGQQQRVAVARGIVHRPRLLVCDEPTSALDQATGQAVMSLLRGLARTHGTTLLVVTHDARVLRHADRVAEMEDGRILRLRDAGPLEDAA